MRNRLTIPLNVLIVAAFAAAPASAQLSDEPDFDACGVLVQGAGCVLFTGGGGSFVLSDYANFKIGDLVRVIGTLDENCITICQEGDGCIRGAEVFDPAVFPCGTPVRVEFDPCSGLSAALLALPLVGMWLCRRGQLHQSSATNSSVVNPACRINARSVPRLSSR